MEGDGHDDGVGSNHGTDAGNSDGYDGARDHRDDDDDRGKDPPLPFTPRVFSALVRRCQPDSVHARFGSDKMMATMMVISSHAQVEDGDVVGDSVDGPGATNNDVVDDGSVGGSVGHTPMMSVAAAMNLTMPI